jgi:hypothetical protein
MFLNLLLFISISFYAFYKSLILFVYTFSLNPYIYYTSTTCYYYYYYKYYLFTTSLSSYGASTFVILLLFISKFSLGFYNSFIFDY